MPTLTVPEISCGHCKAAIEAEVGALDGVDLVEVDVDTKTVRFEGPASTEAVVEAIHEAGYDEVLGA